MNGAQQEAGGGLSDLWSVGGPADEAIGAAVVEARLVAEHSPQEALVAEFGELGSEPSSLGVFSERQVYLESHPYPPETVTCP
ncbi:hypothetical protein SY2F82_74950 [Streptomyces sp. Y2F8-2]|nr:hypothetical protein SY2F82_74950 [Streptomyces sp. Y2F8-2]